MRRSREIERDSDEAENDVAISHSKLLADRPTDRPTTPARGNGALLPASLTGCLIMRRLPTCK